ncbi:MULTISPECIES: M14 family zinc carboxypeptidase [unclassified Peribacillus]|uniref:M14 family zinc carboxypeptidase n=1 Tax=unclassified Peribacillus TaxID=2675266 RepID=UPI00366BEB2F
MARIPDGTLKEWRDVDRVDATAYTIEREVLRVAVNDAQDQVDELKMANLESLGRTEAETIFANKQTVDDLTLRTEEAIQAAQQTITQEMLLSEVNNKVPVVIDEKLLPINTELTGNSVDIKDIKVINPSLNAVWKSPEMPATLRGVQVPSSYNPDVQLAALMDPLVDGEYVTKRSIGKSSSRPAPATTLPSEIFDVWCYEFTPKYPEKTILITALIHGNEYTAFYWATQFADLLVNHYKGDPHLEYLRRSVRIVMVPLVNPYGHLMQTRENINGVDCSRNFDYNWGVSTDEYNQGPAAWSENESKIIRDLMASLPDDTVASLDYHTTLSEGDTHYMLYYPRWMENDVQDYLALIDQIKKPGETTAFANVTLPTLTNWGVYNHGFNAANPEFKNRVDPARTTRDSQEMTRAMKFFGNMVMLAAKKPFRNKGTTISTDELMRVNYDYRTDGGLIPFSYNTDPGTGLPIYTSQGAKTSVRFEAKSEGTWKAFGDVIVIADQDCEISIMSHLYQLGSPDFDFEKTKNDEKNSRILKVKAGEEKVFSIRSAILCHKTNILAANNTNTAMRAREVVWQLRTKIGTTGTANIKFVDMMLEFVPSTNGKRLTTYRTNPAKIDYPTGQETVYKY